jgi:putative glutamine amidotransferase
VSIVPLIAIATCSKLHDYEESVRRAHGDVRIVDARTDTPADVVGHVDGLLLTGGHDVDPALYGEQRHKAYVAAEPGRDQFEIELVRRAYDANLPVFAICRGMQVMNVARDGTLVQDIPDQVGTMNHEVPDPPFAIAHDVWLSEGTLIERLVRERIEGDACPVNSRHHQAVKTVGEGLIVTSTAPDGVIESVEDPTKRFFLGVQWHPENFYRTGEFRALFEGFVEACRR